QVDAGNLNIGPEIEIRTLGLFNEAFAQFFTIVCMKTEVVVDWIVYERELTTDCFVLFEHERVETKLVTPTRGRKTGGTGAYDYDIVHASDLLSQVPAIGNEVSTWSGRDRAKDLRFQVLSLRSESIDNAHYPDFNCLAV